MSNVQISLAELIRRALDSRLTDVFTTLPGVIHKYDTATMTAGIELAVHRPLETDNETLISEPVVILPDVPIQFPRAGTTSYIVFPLAKGDSVLVHFSMWDAAGWRSKGTVGPPDLTDTHLLQSAFAVPCAAPDKDALPAALEAAMCIVSTEVRLGDYVEANLSEVALKSDLQTLYDAIADASFAPNDGGEVLQTNIVSALDLANFPECSPNVKAKKP